MKELNALEMTEKTLTLLQEKWDHWSSELILLLPNIAIASVVVILSYYLSKQIKKYASTISRRIIHDRTMQELIANVVTVAFGLLSLFMVLSILHLDQALTSILAGAGVAGLAVGLALQEPLTNMFAGIQMSTKSQYNIGDLVETNGYFGKIQRITLRSTFISTPLGQVITIPNKMITQQPLTNYSVSGWRKVDLMCGVSYGDDLDKVESLVCQVLRETLDLDRDKVDFFYDEFSDSSINFRARFAIAFDDRNMDYFDARSKVIKAIHKAFNEENITIPFPIRTLDFGIKGGQNLGTALEKPVRRINPELESVSDN